MSVGARHQYQRVARTREKRTRETVEQYATYTRAENENGSCSCAPLPRALRRSTLFGYDFTGLSFFLYLFPPSLPPSSPTSSFARRFFSPRVVHPAAVLSSSHERHPSSSVLVHGRGDTHAHAYSDTGSCASERTTGLVTCTSPDSQRSYGHRRHLA